MNYLLLITIISAICSILSFLTSKVFKSKVWVWSFVVFILTFASGYAVYYNNELKNINNIHRQAKAIYDNYYQFYPKKSFIQETLIFFEINQDRYPDAYKRAMECSKSPNENDAVDEMLGMLKGIATLNEE